MLTPSSRPQRPLPGAPALALSLILPALALAFASAQRVSAATSTVGCANVNVSCTLQELFAGGSLQVGNILFSDFALEVDPGGVNFGAIEVEGLGNSLPFGLKFTANGELRIALADCIDLRFGFDADIVDGGDIQENRLEVVSDNVIGGGLLQLDEAVFGPGPRHIGVKSTEVDAEFEVARRQDSIDIPVETSLFIEKEIFLESRGVGDVAELEVFTQHFLPEPMMSVQLVAGIALLAGAARLGRKRS